MRDLAGGRDSDESSRGREQMEMDTKYAENILAVLQPAGLPVSHLQSRIPYQVVRG